MPETAFQKCAENLEENITLAANQIPVPRKLNEGEIHEIFKRLGLTENPKDRELREKERQEKKRVQAGRMSGAIVANALLFQERIANHYEGIPPIHQLFTQPRKNAQQAAIEAWQKILDINYWPIFKTALQIINELDAQIACRTLDRLACEVVIIRGEGLLYENDLTGHIFQKLIVDRKYLAAFYTLPTSVALLARLAVSKMKDLDWSDADKIGELKIADFACGTGALLSAVYDQIANRYERTGGNPADLHQSLMEDVFHGFDVVHYATCLTASILSGKQPDITYQDTFFCTMPYGRRKNGDTKIGSLEFLDASQQLVLQATKENTANALKRLRLRGHGKESDDWRKITIKDGMMDLVIMNPPFTRPTNHEGKHVDVINPAMAAFGTSDLDMDEMGDKLKKLSKGTCAHGNAGIASAFAAVANRKLKLKPGGVLALVLPLTVAAGASWQDLRTLLAKHYEEVEIVSLATPKNYDVAFSADTAMADCLVIARKKSAYIPKSQPVPTRFVSLRQRPDKLAAAGETARKLNELSAKKIKRKLESGPFGADEVFCGKEKMGETIQANIQRKNPKWNLVRIHDFELVQTAYQLMQSKLHLPKCEARNLAITELKNVGERGLLSRDITGPAPRIRTDKSNQTRIPRGPFELSDSDPTPTDTYPTLWNHNCSKERKLICKPDKKLIARPRMGDKANQVWHQFAGRCHFNLNFTLGSQPLAVAFTEELCIGGDAWPNVNFPKKSWDYAFSIWGNSTLGLLLFWWHGNRQQPGRSRVSLTSAETLPVLDFRALSQAQIKQAKSIFDDFNRKSFRPAYRADVDETREALDRAVLCDWLGFDESIWKAVRQLAHKWCAEPSVHGGK